MERFEPKDETAHHLDVASILYERVSHLLDEAVFAQEEPPLPLDHYQTVEIATDDTECITHTEITMLDETYLHYKSTLRLPENGQPSASALDFSLFVKPGTYNAYIKESDESEDTTDQWQRIEFESLDEARTFINFLGDIYL